MCALSHVLPPNTVGKCTSSVSDLLWRAITHKIQLYLEAAHASGGGPARLPCYLASQEMNMTVPTDKMYPVRATNAAWQKKKSFLDEAKANTKTGLIRFHKSVWGEAMTAPRKDSNSVMVHNIDWKVDGGWQVMARAEKVTVLARFKDGAKFANELTLSEIKAARSRCGVDGRRRTAGRRA
jgi:hypothetical protein